jgi:hypothetical protein
MGIMFFELLVFLRNIHNVIIKNIGFSILFLSNTDPVLRCFPAFVNILVHSDINDGHFC